MLAKVELQLFFQAEQTVRKRLPKKHSPYEVRGSGLAPWFKVRT